MKNLPLSPLGSLSPVMPEVDQWEPFRDDYTSKVFCPAIFPGTRAALLDEVKAPRILDLGCGPTGIMVNELVSRFPNAEIFASDFSAKMLETARATVASSKVQFVLVDNRDLHREFGSDFFDTVISINSILPECRQDVDRMILQVVRVLKPGGRFVALLPAFETSLMARKFWGLDIQIDSRTHREFDTTGWQCYYTNEDIYELMQRHGFAKFSCRQHRFESQWARNVIRRIYGREIADEVLVKYPLFEHFVVAEKPV